MWISEKFVEANKKEATISPNGWLGPLVVEYALVRVGEYDPSKSVCFRVKGTNHTFAIFETIINSKFHGEYQDYFKKTLESFREDFLEWKEDEITRRTPWFLEYEKEYRGRLIH